MGWQKERAGLLQLFRRKEKEGSRDQGDKEDREMKRQAYTLPLKWTQEARQTPTAK